MSQARCNYHHGDLRNALIVAAAELIERDCTLDFSMAEAAASAGVSAAAPYRHFADKEELLRAVRELAILGLGYAAADTASQHPAGSIDSILAMGHLSRICPGETRTFSLMWKTVVIWRATRESERNGGFMVLVDLVRAFCEANGHASVVHLATRSGRRGMALPHWRPTNSSTSLIVYSTRGAAGSKRAHHARRRGECLRSLTRALRTCWPALLGVGYFAPPPVARLDSATAF